MIIGLKYNGRPAELIHLWRGRWTLRLLPTDYAPWEYVAQGSRTYLTELCD